MKNILADQFIEEYGVDGPRHPYRWTEEEKRADVHYVGDLLEAGEWSPWTGPVIQGVENNAARYGPQGPQTLSVTTFRDYSKMVPRAGLGTCDYQMARGKRIGICMLPCEHEDWRGDQRFVDAIGRVHRVYLFSARDSAQMLAGMRRRLTEPMEEL